MLSRYRSNPDSLFALPLPSARFARQLTGRYLIALVVAVAVPHTSAATIILTGDAGASNVTQVGLDTEPGLPTGTARPSVAPIFPTGFEVIDGADITVSATSSLNANYDWLFINDDTGFNFLSDSVTGSGLPGTNRGWIPATTGTETATFSFASPLADLSGIDFLTLFNGRTAGSFQFQYSTDNQSSWQDLATVTNDDTDEVFRMGFSFDQLSGVTDARLITSASDNQLFIGEVNFLVPEPSTALCVGMGLFFLSRRRSRKH